MWPRAMPWFAITVAVCAPVAAATQEHAPPKPLRVTMAYDAGPGCPDADDFKSVVEKRLGYDAFDQQAPDRVLVDIGLRGRTFEGRIEWRNAEGRWAGDRTFRSRSDDCSDLARAMAFALALQIQFAAIARDKAIPAQTPPPPPPTPPPPLQSAPSDAKPVADKAEPAAAGRPVLSLEAGGAVGLGMASGAVPFGRLAAAAVWAPVFVELAAEVAWPTTTRRADGAGFSQQQLLAALAGCGQRGRVGACVVAKAGEIRVDGLQVDRPATPAGLLLQTGLRLVLRQDLGRHAYLAAHAEGLLNLRAWRVTLDNDVVWTSPRFAETVGLYVGVRFH